MKIPLMMFYQDWKKIIRLSIPNLKSKFYPLFKKKKRKIAKIKKRIGRMILNRNWWIKTSFNWYQSTQQNRFKGWLKQQMKNLSVKKNYFWRELFLIWMEFLLLLIKIIYHRSIFRKYLKQQIHILSIKWNNQFKILKIIFQIEIMTKKILPKISHLSRI